MTIWVDDPSKAKALVVFTLIYDLVSHFLILKSRAVHATRGFGSSMETSAQATGTDWCFCIYTEVVDKECWCIMQFTYAQCRGTALSADLPDGSQNLADITSRDLMSQIVNFFESFDRTTTQ